jgi:hypothetical protein
MTDITPTLCPRTGRWTWPHIVQYRITEGPQRDTVMNAPPDRKVFPAPLERDPVTGRLGRRTGGAAFELLIHDLSAYEALARTGSLYRPEHTGSRAECEDNRSTS